jgi:hypothetical protein
MITELGCHGRVVVGKLPPEVAALVDRVPAEWLDYNPTTGAFEVRHVQPSDAPILPTVVSELAHMLHAIPYDLRRGIEGGQLLVHTEDEGRLVRIVVDRGGSFHVEWAHPGYTGSQKRPYTGHEIQIQPFEHRLNGKITLRAEDATATARALQSLADTYEGLYPEGEFSARPASGGSVELTLQDVNLDVRLLIDALERRAAPRSLGGRITLDSFKEAMPEHMLRFVFERGEVWVQRPVLWTETE